MSENKSEDQPVQKKNLYDTAFEIQMGINSDLTPEELLNQFLSSPGCGPEHIESYRGACQRYVASHPPETK